MFAQGKLLFGIVLAAAALAGGGLWLASRGAAPAAGATMVYVCSETGEVVSAPSQPLPALNPRTGRNTLLRGVYCPQCGRWYAAPPPDHFAGNPRELTCRIHNVPMTAEGPVN